MQALPLIIAVVGSVASAQMTANAAETQANYDNAIAQQNMKISQRRAAMERADRTRQGERDQSTAIAQFAKSGIDISMGTPLDVFGDIAQETAYDIQKINFDAATNEAGFRNQAAASKAKASQTKKASWTEAAFSSGSSILADNGQAFGSAPWIK